MCPVLDAMWLNMASKNVEEGFSDERGGSLSKRLAIFSNTQLIEEVITVWDELIRSEQELVNTRQRLRALEIEFSSSNQEVNDRARTSRIEEELRVAKTRIAQLELFLENAEARIFENNNLQTSGRFEELQKENVRLLQSEEEQLLLILDMEEQLDKLIKKLKED